ncbi:LiaI-LiaF-like domain-containing protein [Haloimpatiens lingqiaonensis]|uniref:LiaI-LiaF-like domain-containing protein n=1 Tax=Haloimpatiens lingqiaonensis TaxID=1380675 RepID=UPI0010FD5807|nr:DUF5668 domain-containing protein [Haloimpatiens lingqiaonensis]
MKRTGTITSAIALIFYGVWLAISNVNYNLAKEIFKWWPFIFILLGVEVLYLGKKEGKENKSIGFNYLIIPILILFIGTNSFYYLRDDSGIFKKNSGEIKQRYKEYFKNSFHIKGVDIDKNKSKRIKVDKTLDIYGKQIKCELPNSKIKIKNSYGNEIRLDLEVYVDKNKAIRKYEINTEKENEGYKINFPEAFVNGVEGTLYVPKDMYVKINGTNLDIESGDFRGDIDIDGSNCDIDLEGDIRKSVIDISNGKINLKNSKCSNIKIDASNATVTVNTKDKNFKANLDISNGVCKFNNEKKVNSGLSRNLGNGDGILNIDISNGTINVKSEE